MRVSKKHLMQSGNEEKFSLRIDTGSMRISECRVHDTCHGRKPMARRVRDTKARRVCSVAMRAESVTDVRQIRRGCTCTVPAQGAAVSTVVMTQAPENPTTDMMAMRTNAQ